MQSFDAPVNATEHTADPVGREQPRTSIQSLAGTAATCIALAVAATVARADFPDRNVQVVGLWTKVGVDFSDVWGIAYPDGRELAVVLRTDGTSFVETTNPGLPVEKAFIPGAASTHRSCKTYSGYAYLVTEGGGGIQIVDIKDPDDIQLLTTWGSQVFHHSHNIGIDLTSGLAFACGTDNGMEIIDLADPLNPVFVASYYRYVHDMYAANGLAHLALIEEGRYQILDLTQLPAIVELDSVYTPAEGCHTTWVDPDDTFCVTCDEKGAAGHMALYDVRDPNDIRYLSEFRAPTQASIHNAYPVGDTVHASWYQQGYVACNVSERTRPRYLGSKDFGEDKIWGVYPFQPSGNLYLSSIRFGLIIVRLDAVIIDATARADSCDESGPYPVLAHVFRTRDTAPPQGSARLRFSFDGVAYHDTPMQPTGNPNEYLGEIPGVAAPALVSYYIEAGSGVDAARFPQTGHELHFRVGKVTTLFAEDFEAGDEAGWTHGADSGLDDWERGVPTGEAEDPPLVPSGSNLFGTLLAGAAQPSSTRWLRSPPLDLQGHSNVRLRYLRWLAVDGTQGDAARLEVNGTTIFQNSIQKIVDHEWMQHDVDLSAYAFQDSVQLEFRLDTTSASALGGWNIDAVQIYALEDDDDVPGALWLMALKDAQSVRGLYGQPVSVRPEDLVVYDVCNNGFAMYFDGSDVLPAGADIAACHYQKDGSLLLGFEQQILIQGLAGGPEGDLVRRQDLVRFVPASLGDATAGAFEFYFDGSDVELAGAAIDSIARLGPRLLVSLSKNHTISNLGVVSHADVIAFRGLNYGAGTQGVWDPYLSGAAVGLDQDSEGIDACALAAGSSDLMVSTRGRHVVTGLQGQDDDIVLLRAVDAAFLLLFDGLQSELDSNDVDALAVIQ